MGTDELLRKVYFFKFERGVIGHADIYNMSNINLKQENCHYSL
jgi:hypothetical protein